MSAAKNNRVKFDELSQHQIDRYNILMKSVYKTLKPTMSNKEHLLARIRQEVRSRLGSEDIRVTTESFNSKTLTDFNNMWIDDMLSKYKNQSESPQDENVFSTGEELVKRILEKLMIPYKHETVLKGLNKDSDKSVPLPCDFVISVQNYIAMIEYNGPQHYKPVMDNITRYANQVQNDARRINFALNNHVPLLVIHHDDGNKDNLIDIIDRFITDLKSNVTTSKSYSSKTYGYFSGFDSNNTKLHDEIFPKNIYPSIKQETDIGYVQLNAEQIIIWDKKSLDKIIKENHILRSMINKLQKENNKLKDSLENVSKTLEDTTKQLNQPKRKEVSTAESNDANLENMLYANDLENLLSDEPKKEVPLAIRTYVGGKGHRTKPEMKQYIYDLYSKQKLTGPMIVQHLKNYNIKMTEPQIYKYINEVKNK